MKFVVEKSFRGKKFVNPETEDIFHKTVYSYTYDGE